MDVTVNEQGYEEHPSFGMVRVVRSSGTPVSLFDSEIKHQHFVTLTINRADRRRELNNDWIHPTKQLIEIEMSEAQWAQVISSVGSSGTPVTIRWTGADGLIPRPPYAPRMEHSLAEVRDAAQKMFDKAMDALAAAEARPTKANLRNLRLRMEQSAGNVVFAAQSLDEHIEKTVAHAKADIEAMTIAASMDFPAFPSLQRGLEQAAAGELEDLGSFQEDGDES